MINPEEQQLPIRMNFLPTAIDSVLYEENRAKLLSEFASMQTRGTSAIYENQRNAGEYVVEKFTDSRHILNVMVIARTQSGKTGVACAIIQKFMEAKATSIPIENIYIITGVSSKEWLDQTRSRMPPLIRDRVFHRPNLTKTFMTDLKGKRNVLIITDEIQVAANKEQTLHRVFQSAGLTNIDHMLQNDIKLVEISATPDGTCYDLAGWTVHASKILMEPGEGYTSSYDLMLQNRVRQSDQLDYVRPGDANQFNIIAEDMLRFSCPKYHIVRCSTYMDSFKHTVRNLMKKFEQGKYTYLLFDQTSKNKDINVILRVKPTKHTFILIKETLRCAKSITKTHVGILYDRVPESISNSVIIQSLIGRCTGYDDNGESIVYTDIPSIIQYEELWNSGFSETIRWKSMTTRHSNHINVSKQTFLSIPIVVPEINVDEL
jgi:hypothetical protein